MMTDIETAIKIARGVASGENYSADEMVVALRTFAYAASKLEYPSGQIPFQELLKGVRAEIASRREGAAYGGERGDRGASILEENLRWYIKGLDNVYPTEWEKYAIAADPEYQEYLRLQKKFSNK